MFYEKWMSYIKDDICLRNVVIPGSHDAGTYEMMRFARCQKDSFYEQYKYGVRYFDTRFHIENNGRIVFEHGVLSGKPFEEGLCDIRKMLENNDSEFFIFKVHHPEHEYLIGKIGRKYKQNLEEVNELLEKHIEPSKYAFTDFGDITKVTMGELRASGKRYILNWDNEGMAGAVNTPVFDPWRPDWHGMKVESFFDNTIKYFDDVPEKSLFCYFTQRTPGVGTQEGLKCPDTLEVGVRNNFHKLTGRIASDEKLLQTVNIITGDFMTESHFKTNMILKLNLDKNNVKQEYAEEFRSITKV